MLSKRLKSIASMVDKGNNIYDIGCDHALLDIYLAINNDNHCTASDINQNALNNAIKNIEKYHLSDKIDTVISDGLKNITLKEDSTIILSGMGSRTIIDILSPLDSKLVNSIIVQSNNDLSILRKRICKLGYYIFDEDVVLDKGIYYVIIKFKPGYKKYHFKDYELGPILVSKGKSDYYSNLKSKNEQILNSVPKRYVVKRLKLKKMNYLINKFKLG